MDGYNEKYLRSSESEPQFGYCLNGLNFPAGKESIQEYSRTRCSQETVERIDRLPEGEYKAVTEIQDELGESRDYRAESDAKDEPFDTPG
jgi:hypothetical protein